VHLRARDESGFGMLELLMAMVMLNVGILALITAFQSGAFALKRAGKVSTAAAIADIQMERYRGYKYCSISFAPADATAAVADATYASETALIANTPLTPATDDTACTSSTPPAASQPIQTITGPDKNNYRVDTYIFTDSVNAARPLKRVTIIVRDANNGIGQALARVASTFDKATAQ
jgi:type II secretory pathway pseudopilin PulG